MKPSDWTERQRRMVLERKLPDKVLAERLGTSQREIKRQRELMMAAQERRAPVGEAFDLAGIPVLRCDKCLVVRELSSFWRPGASNKPAAAVEVVCTRCR